jgi:3-hydroxyisobutyrate dehydrogenase-like beta-hydroxyacid dehydrogenase
MARIAFIGLGHMGGGMAPTMRVKVPPAAAAIPPETGASRKSNPLACIASPTSRADATSMVEQSISKVPGAALCATSSLKTAQTCFAAGSMVMTTSAPFTASPAEAAGVQPPFVAC